MQKKLGSLAAAFLLVAAANAKAADLYEECLDKKLYERYGDGRLQRGRGSARDGSG